ASTGEVKTKRTTKTTVITIEREEIRVIRRVATGEARAAQSEHETQTTLKQNPEVDRPFSTRQHRESAAQCAHADGGGRGRDDWRLARTLYAVPTLGGAAS